MDITLDPAFPSLFSILLIIFFIAFIFSYLRQPILVGYLLTGIIIGPYGLGLVENAEVIRWLGSLGVVLLLFFLGMEMPIRKLLANWRVATFGTFLQVVCSVLAVWLVGH